METMKTKKVIDGETMKCLQTFDAKDTTVMLVKYQEDGRWQDVSTDNDGDIILWEKL